MEDAATAEIARIQLWQWQYAGGNPLHNAVQFFNWKGIRRKDMGGGSWNVFALSSLLAKWTQVEQTFIETLRMVGDPHGESLLEHYGPALLYFDDLTFERTRGWTRWDEGLGHTLRYTKELCALSIWLREL